ncbi:hypothetical protein GO594_01800 [Pseudomonas otitidis]|uniref:Uncharacterized protein n=1 Tax=Metapseudomonas otitidis TaxID=319939 RepID=A0A7X3H3W0_9GAMM|nr:hypothetical protein [Pseudomonas otitidis]MWK54700.1 hypothetical protein [Pseudomonas otitidis]
MTIRRCPGCSAVLQQQEITVGGVTELYWVCPEGDWEEPVNNAKANQQEAEEDAPD